jgi:hypothetical protein
VGIVICYGLDNLGFELWEGQEIFLFSKMSRLAVGPPQAHVQ